MDKEKIKDSENLDQLLTVVTPRLWAGLISLMVLIGIILLWAFFGSIPIKVEGRGIVMNQQGVLLNIQAHIAGTISEIDVVSSQKVKKDDLIAKIYDAEESFKLENAKSTLENKKKDLEKIKFEIERESAANKKAIETELAAKTYSVKQLEARIATLEGDVEKKRKLVSEGLISPIALHDAEDKLANAHIELETVKAAIESINYNLLKGYRMEDLKSKETSVGKAQDELILLELRKPLYSIYSPTEGKILELRISQGDTVQPGTPVAWMEAASGEETPYVVSGYFPIEQGKRISVGNEVQIELSTVDFEEYGYLLGKVKEVSGFAVSKDSIEKAIHNKELVNYLTSGAEAVVQVLIEIQRDPNTSEYKWSSGEAPTEKITTGTVGKLHAIIHRIRPIYYVLPLDAFQF